MSYGELKIDTITFTSAGVDTSVSVSGLVQNPTFTGNITTTGTISGDVIRGNTVSGVTITGETGEFAGAITASGFIPNGTGVLTNGLYSPAANRVALSTNSTNHFTVTESGVFLFATGVVATGVVDRGGTTQFTPKTQLAGQGSNRDTALSFLHYSSAGFSPTIVLGTSNSNTFGEYTDTVSGRVYGDILFETANETNDRFGAGALIRGFADHTPGAGLNGVPGALTFQTGPAGTVGTTERMRIASSGNVGIGNFTSDNPDALLELRGSASVVGTPELFISNIGAVASGNTSSTVTFRGGSAGNETNIARFTVIADGDDENGSHLAFETTASGGALTERMRIVGSGNVGIGLTDPSTTLHLGNSGVLRINNTDGTRNAELFNDASNVELKASVDPIRINAFHSSGYIRFDTNDTPRARIDSSGRFLIGNTAAVAIAGENVGRLQLYGTGPTANSWMHLGRFADNNGGAAINFAKSRGTTTTDFTIAQDNDTLGSIGFYGADGVDFNIPGAQIQAVVDGTPVANQMPASIYFKTNGGGSSVATRVTVDAGGSLGVGTDAPSDYGKFVSYYQSTRYTAIDAFGRLAARYDDNSAVIYPITVKNTGMTTIGHGCGYRFILGKSGTDYNGGALMSVSEDNYTSSATANSSLYFQTAAANNQATRVIIYSNGDIRLQWANNSYEPVVISHTSTYGNGTMQIQPVTYPGSGTANHYTHFADKGGAGTTKHNVVIDGALSKGSGSFRIPHPLKPETHELVHSFIEGPQADLIYRGHIQLVNGTATVNIDEAARMTEGTFEALCTNVCCFTSNESDWTAVRGSVSGNILTIEAQDPTSTAEICWMVVGERKDPHMIETDWTDENGRVITEPLKQTFPASETETISA